MKLSVVVVTWNSGGEIEPCLDSIRCSCTSEIIVVDNGSTDDTVDRLKRFPRVRVERNCKNEGYARANNQGLAVAQGEHVLLLNPDTRVIGDAIDVMVSCLDGNEDIAAVAPQLLSLDGSVQDSIRSLPSVGAVFWELLGLAALFPKSRRFGGWRLRCFDYARSGFVEQPMASCLMLRASILKELGGMDERFPVFYNDVDLSRRMHDSGMRTYYVPAARVFHQRGASTGKVKPRMIWEAHRSLFRYLAKHDRSGLFWLKATLLLPALELAALVRVVGYRLKIATK